MQSGEGGWVKYVSLPCSGVHVHLSRVTVYYKGYIIFITWEIWTMFYCYHENLDSKHEKYDLYRLSGLNSFHTTHAEKNISVSTRKVFQSRYRYTHLFLITDFRCHLVSILFLSFCTRCLRERRWKSTKVDARPRPGSFTKTFDFDHFWPNWSDLNSQGVFVRKS